MTLTEAEAGKPVAEYSLLDEQVLACPFEFYKRLHEECPVYQMPETGIYVVTKYDDILAVTRDTETFSNVILAMEALQGENGRRYQEILRERGWEHVHVLHRSDPPTHSHHRKLVDRVFAPPRIRALVPAVERLAHELIDRFIDRGECDLLREFALPLPGMILGEQLGLDKNEFARFQAWALAFLSTGNKVMDDDELLATAEIELDAQAYLAGILEARRREPTGDLISNLVHAAKEGEEPFTMHELQNLMHQLITGGYETTTSAITHGMWLLMRHPDQLEKLRADPKLLPNFVEEVLRIESPVQGLMRHVTRDAEVSGTKIPAGSTVLLRYGAANRDAEQFACPEAFDVARPNARRHLAFGTGIHHCLGAALARQEILTGVGALLERMEDFALARPLPEPAYVYSLNFRPLKEFPLRFRKRAA
jgi:cytochrome P450